MTRFVKFNSATDPKIEVHINPDEVAAVRDSHGKTIILFRGIAATETVQGSIASVVRSARWSAAFGPVSNSTLVPGRALKRQLPSAVGLIVPCSTM